jgi:hypothetical protein
MCQRLTHRNFTELKRTYNRRYAKNHYATMCSSNYAFDDE